MTICIAAICERGKYLVAMADRMITYTYPPFHQFEHPVPKIHIISNNIVLMTAGSALLPSEFIDEIQERLGKNFGNSEIATISVKDAVKVVKEAYLSLRRRAIEERFLQKYDLKWDDYIEFIKGSAPREYSVSPPIMRIFTEIDDFKIELSAIIAGLDHEGPHIYIIEDPGILSNFNDIGYAAIGSGNYHAMRSFIENNYSIDMPVWQALYIVYEAKKYAESAPGVGKRTDAIIITREGVHKISQEEIEILENIYREKQEKITEIKKEIFDENRENLKRLIAKQNYNLEGRST